MADLPDGVHWKRKYEQLCANLTDILLGTVENGPWVLIEIPALREFVGQHVGDTAYQVADAAGLDEVRLPALELRGYGGLPTAPDARERLARWLFADDAGSVRLWDEHVIDRTAWLDRADEVLAVIAGKDG